MAELEDLSEYVVVHPDDYERRWTLAKKLYMAWEYNAALKHLLILKKHWTRKLNVLRYLAATYYRLGRYDEAIVELVEISNQWPQEVAVLEQLARVYEVSGKNHEAAHTWERVLQLLPDHPVAARSVQRLRSPSGDIRREDLRLRDSDSGIDMSPYRICKNCGAQNSDEFDRCWQCHSALGSTISEFEGSPTSNVTPGKSWIWTLLAGTTSVAALSAAVYLTFIHLRMTANGQVPQTVHDVLANGLLVPRLVTATVLFVTWPAGIWLGLRSFGLRALPRSSAWGLAVLVAAVTYLCMWAPVLYLPYAALLPGAVSFVAILGLRLSRFWRSVGVWFVHGILPTVAALGVFCATAGIRPLTEFVAIYRYTMSSSGLASTGRYPLFAETAPAACVAHWESTGSSWLDDYGSLVELEFVAEEAGDKLEVEVKRGGEVVAETKTPPYRATFRVRTSESYEVWIHGAEGVRFHSFSNGVLQPTLGR